MRCYPVVDYTTTLRMRHCPSHRLWFGVQTADTKSDGLKELKRSRPECFVLPETKQFQNSFKTVSKQFSFSFISLGE